MKSIELVRELHILNNTSAGMNALTLISTMHRTSNFLCIQLLNRNFIIIVDKVNFNSLLATLGIQNFDTGFVIRAK